MSLPRLALLTAFLLGLTGPSSSAALIPWLQDREKSLSQKKKPPQQETKPQPKQEKPAPKEEPKTPKLPELVTSEGSVIIGGQKVEYRTTAGTLPSVDKTGKAKANIFYTAYTRKTGESLATRRLTFCFNGGPGSASAYVHLGFFGPRRILINDDGLSIATPTQMVDNDCSILDVTDLVFIDPVSTGYSRAENPKEATLFHGLEEDTQSVGEFIRDYVAKFGRQESPVYIAGESYGTMRAASLSSYLQGRGGVKLAGIVLISSVLDWATIRFGPGNDLPYALFLPTYTAAAYHHGKLDKRWATDLQTALKEAQRYADGPYLEVLHKGNLLSDYERQAAAKQIAMLTGLSEEFVLRNDLRIEATRFRMELLRDKQVVIGRLDSRVASKPRTGPDAAPTAASGTGGTNGGDGNRPSGGNQQGRQFRGGGGGDPSQAMLATAFTEAMRTYLPDGMGYKTSERYQLSAQVQPWSYGQAGNNRYANVAPRLRAAMEKDKALRVFVASGYTDLATPFAGTNYTFAHLGPRALMDQVTMTYYDAGHMMYTHEPSRRKLREDLVKFMTAPVVVEKKN
jgi:carboxypeptidase C (cathepsin A)